MSQSKRPVAVVVWNDAHGSVNKDIDPDSVQDHKPMVMTTMGWLLVDNEQGVTVAMEKFVEEGKDYYRGATFVPRGMITSVTQYALTKIRVKAMKRLADLERPVGPMTEPKTRGQRL